MRRIALTLILICLLSLFAGCQKKESIPDPVPAAEAFYNNEIKNVDSELVRERLTEAKMGELLEEYPEMEELFLSFIEAYLNGITFRILPEEVVIDEVNMTAQLIAEVSCFDPQKLYDRLRTLRNEHSDEIMLTGVMPDDDELQIYFFEQGIELMKSGDAERKEGGYQHITMSYDVQSGQWTVSNGPTLILNLLP